MAIACSRMQESKHVTQRWCRPPAQWSLLAEYKCAQGAHYGVTLPRYMLCIGAQTQGMKGINRIFLLLLPYCFWESSYNHLMFPFSFLFQKPSLSLSRWQAHSMGQLHHKQSACHSPSLKLGYDMCLCTIWLFCSLWWSRQHLLYLQVKISCTASTNIFLLNHQLANIVKSLNFVVCVVKYSLLLC